MSALSATHTSTTLSQDNTGSGGKTLGIVMNGGNNYLATSVNGAPGTFSYNFLAGFTFEIVVNISAATQYPLLIGIGQSGWGTSFSTGMVLNMNNLKPYVYTTGPNYFNNQEVATNRFYHLVVSVSSSGSATFYMNNQPAGTATGIPLPSSPVSGGILGMGYVFSNGAVPLIKGTIAQVRVYQGGLTSTQISQNYNTIKNLSGNPYGLP